MADPDAASRTVDARQVVIERVVELAPQSDPLRLLYLAEALAWATRQDQPHGSSPAPERA